MRHQNLKVWQAAMSHATVAYRLTGQFPQEERFGLTSQIRRAAVSIAANIAEGAARASAGEFLQSLSVAMGEAAECLTLWEIAWRTGTAVKEPGIERSLNEIAWMLGALRRVIAISREQSPGTPQKQGTTTPSPAEAPPPVCHSLRGTQAQGKHSRRRDGAQTEPQPPG